MQVPKSDSGRFRKVPEGSEMYWSESSGVLAEVAGAKRFGEVPEGSGESRARHRFWRVLLAYEQNNAPMCTFEIEKANAHDTAMYALLLLGIPPKLILHGRI